MTILEALHAANSVRPNDYSDETKLQWLSDFDGKVWQDLIMTHKPAPHGHFRGYDGTTDIESTQLLIPAPHTGVYALYIAMMVDMHNGDIMRYENSREVFMTAYSGFTDWYNRTHRPCGVRALRF